MKRVHPGAPTKRRGAGALTTILTTVLVVSLVLSAVAHATTFRERSLDELFRATEIGFYGTVRELSTENRDGDPYTLVTFEVARAFRGVPEGATGGAQTVQLAFLGGTLPDGQTLSVEGMPGFELGDEVLVLAYDAPYYSPIVGFSQGLWRRTPSGLVDPFGRSLGLSAAGTLVRGGDNTDVQAVLAAVQQRLLGTP
jgi:hypothetical protein